MRCGVKDTFLTLWKFLDGDFRGDFAGVLRDLVAEMLRFVGDTGWRDGVLTRAERGVAAGCGGLGEGGGRYGASEVVVMVMSRVLGKLGLVFTWTGRL